jgi:hypothetical protein
MHPNPYLNIFLSNCSFLFCIPQEHFPLRSNAFRSALYGRAFKRVRQIKNSKLLDSANAVDIENAALNVNRMPYGRDFFLVSVQCGRSPLGIRNISHRGFSFPFATFLAFALGIRNCVYRVRTFARDGNDHCGGVFVVDIRGVALKRHAYRFGGAARKMLKRLLPFAVRHACGLGVHRGELYERPRLDHGRASADALLNEAVSYCCCLAFRCFSSWCLPFRMRYFYLVYDIIMTHMNNAVNAFLSILKKILRVRYFYVILHTRRAESWLLTKSYSSF